MLLSSVVIYFRKGKIKPFGILEKNETDSFLKLFTSMGDRQASTDIDVASEFVCRMYTLRKTGDVSEARYQKLMQMSGNINKVINTSVQGCV